MSKADIAREINTTRAFLGTLEAKMLGVVFHRSDAIETYLASDHTDHTVVGVSEEQPEETHIFKKTAAAHTPHEPQIVDPNSPHRSRQLAA